jgi:UDP-N-acetylmuramyl tripeptide synthase
MIIHALKRQRKSHSKGHENYQIIENNRIAFSDQEEAMAALQTAQLSGSTTIEGGGI